MTQLDPRNPTTTPPQPKDHGASAQKPEPSFNWRVSIGIALGLLILFGVLFGLRAAHIFPPEPTQDSEMWLRVPRRRRFRRKWVWHLSRQ
jgi:hypothetical protein